MCSTIQIIIVIIIGFDNRTSNNFTYFLYEYPVTGISMSARVSVCVCVSGYVTLRIVI